ncbi:MAG: ATP-dependent helicase [Butyrivibrio sp.]|uniref:ATP-dependent helicase n=1 Tax=Butyrivibrio sp. TaxID=28121 RepID=UPI0025C17564|nr:ATP-dependent helicase [Butyrivibrio sp.]MBQ6587424.1 ATP-dependent helicase [Butyrivibrio sp.]MBQ7614200.1 ATP-dependent helicase [Butyrivibrio sp.]
MTDKEFIDKYGHKLNNEQLTAVRTIEGPVLLLAVPGSGKTTVLVNRLGYMLYVNGIAPENILTLTYTVAATRDMARRFEALFGKELSDTLEFRTINGICAKIISHYGRLIGKKSFDLITDEKVSGKILTDLYVKVCKEYPTESDIKNIRTLITYCKNMMLTEKEIRQRGEEEGIELWELYDKYNKELKARSLMDYDDQMIYAYRMLKGSKELLEYYRNLYRYICVDEAQDTSKIQHMIISLLAGDAGNLFMVGDEDQSIYGFRAAYPEALLNFEKEHKGAKVLVMDKNYRSNAKIVQTADKFIQKNFNRHEKHMSATRSEAADINYLTLDSRKGQYKYLFEMAKDISEQTAVLYRDNESILPLVDMLDREDMPYRIKSADMAFFTHRVVVDVVNILKFALSPMDPELFMKIYFKFQTYLRKPDAEQMCQMADFKHIGILDAVEDVEVHKATLANVRSLRTHFRSMSSENPAKAINRINKYMGYGDYLRDNNMDDNKLFILEMLAKNEATIQGFLDRLEELRQILTEKEDDYSAKLILSTIHSSKGLEYDNVILMDVINGVFPSKIIKNFKTASPQEKRDYEEERRIFYVGMTRAKDKLTIMRYDDEPSIFVGELSPKGETVRKKKETKTSPKAGLKTPTMLLKKKTKLVTSGENVPENLVMGERVYQERYGEGTISDVTWDEDEIPTKFTVEFDDGTERKFIYPFAFTTGMRVIE